LVLAWNVGWRKRLPIITRSPPKETSVHPLATAAPSHVKLDSALAIQERLDDTCGTPFLDTYARNRPSGDNTPDIRRRMRLKDHPGRRDSPEGPKIERGPSPVL
jgi:hypothetical protein